MPEQLKIGIRALDVRLEASLYDKWDDIVDNWTIAVAYARTGGTSRGYINYLSGNGGSFPYFVASGWARR